MYNSIVTFEWDDNKADANEINHEAAFAEAVTVFDDSLAVVARDPDHSNGELRLLILGETPHFELPHSEQCRTPNEAFNLRLISARLATRREKKDYENG